MAKPNNVSTAKLKAAAAAAAASKGKHGNNNDDIWSVDPLVDPVFGKGQIREYLITNPSPIALQKRQFVKQEYFFLFSLIVIGLVVRLRGLSYPNSVVFDEVHFGGFARKYILGKFFMDVHPPLAKMLFAAIGSIGGFNGDFEFKKIGDKFPETVPYVFMRQFPALLGVATVVLCYLTLRQSGVRPIISFVTGLLLLIENSNVTISRYILLDSPLVFFIAAAIYSWKKFEIQIPFTFGWYRSLLATSIALGLALSSKWVGLFTVAWVGLLCVYQLWFIIGDLTVSTRKILAHFFLRGFTLLGVPIVLYLVFFVIHFEMLPNEGDGSAFMSSAFRAGLNGNKIPRDITAEVGLGSVVTIRHMDTQGGYLHSHQQFYPTGSKQQQITLYPHLDSNNKWLIEPFNGTIYNDTFVPLINGMKIRLKHINTGRRLHSHDEKPPVSERDWQKECSCYGFDGFNGDANDDWVVEIVQYRTKDDGAKAFVKALKTVFRLRHAMTGNYLFSSEVKLPEWGFGQQEVTSASQGKRPLSHWYIEQNENEYLPKDRQTIINYPKLSFWEKFAESHKRMWKINQGLTDHHHWQSDPSEWPFLLRGINYWTREHKQVYLLGNAVTWWAATTCIFTFIIYAAITVFKYHVGKPLSTNKHVFNFNVQTFSYILGWALHYLPFFIMGRQLFLHHYLPSLYFAILSLGHFLEIFTTYLTSSSRLLRQMSMVFVALILVLSTVFYLNYSPLIYATPWTKAACEVSKPFKTWDYDCNFFHKDIAEYQFDQESAETAEPAKEHVADEAKQTPKAVPNIAKEEIHIEEPPVDAEEAPVQEHEQLAPPGVNIDTKSNKDDDKDAPAEPVVENNSKAEPVVQEPVVANDDEIIQEAAEAPPVEHIEKPVLDDIPQYDQVDDINQKIVEEESVDPPVQPIVEEEAEPHQPN
nr:uncharacterized protein [Candida metapsilosis]